MTNKRFQEDIKIATIYRVLMAFCVSNLCFTLFFGLFPRGHLFDVLIPSLNAAILIILLGYFHQKPYQRAKITITLCAIIGIISLAPVTFYFIITSWLGYWRFVDEYPPITGIMMASTAVAMIMLPQDYKKYVALIWGMLTAPVLLYFCFHLDEMHSPRGYELMALLIPTSLLLYAILPYQRKVIRHLDFVASKLKQSEEVASRDFLTDIYNRRGLERWLADVQPNTSICVLLIDIDHFKKINDNLGHSTGDRVLVEFASRLRIVYQGEHCLARWGGEEFIVILVNPKPIMTPVIGEMFKNTLSLLPYRTVGKVTASLGVSTTTQKEHLEQMLDEADQALYYAKANNRDQVATYNDVLSTIKTEKTAI